MNESLSPNTKAILLLTAPLILGRGATRTAAYKPLTLKKEYSRLARRLGDLELEPADLLGGEAAEVLGRCLPLMKPRIDRARIEYLLGRGLQLSLAVERWQARAIWVLSRADDEYPRRLKRRLGQRAPAVLYGCGDRSFLDCGGLAVVGPRNAGDELMEYARAVGAHTGGAGRSLVSGGARGVDQAAMNGALEAGGRAVGVLANGLGQAATNREHRGLLLDRRLVLISPYDPGAGFFAGHAMERNHHVYALADAGLVVDALPGRGGTWAGASAQLRRSSGCPVYVRSPFGESKGLEALSERGARPWPEPMDPASLGAVLDAAALEGIHGAAQQVIPGVARRRS